MPAILLRIPYVQQQVSSIATEELSNYLGVPVRIGNVDIEWFNHLALEDLYLEDQQGKVLFEANRVSAGFELKPLLEGKLVFTSARLLGFSLNLNKPTPKDKLNLQFVIDAFASKDTLKKRKDIDLRFNSVLIRKGNIKFDVASAKETPGKFNPKHIDIRNLSAKIALKAFNKDSLNATIKKMNFMEANGFFLERLMVNVVANHDSAQVNNFEIQLPLTHLKIQKAMMNLTEVNDINDFLNHAPVQLDIAPSQICLKDLTAFVPAFKNFADTIELTAGATGTINDINMQRLSLKYSDKLLFEGKMDLKGITHPATAYLFGQVRRMYITNDGLTGLINNFSQQDVALPKQLHELGTIHFTGEIAGFFDNLVAFGNFSTAIGSIQTDMIIGKNKEQNIATYLKGNITSSDLQLDRLFPENNPYGNIRFNIKLDTQRPIDGNFAGDIKAEIQEFDFKQYKYENILLTGNFKKNSFDGSVSVNDPNGQLQAEGFFRHQGQNSLFNFTADVKNLRLDSLHLTQKYEEPEISFALNADFTGNNIDNAEGIIRLDSFSFKTKPHQFFLDKLEINASGHSEKRHLTIRSEQINGEVIGAYSFTTIVPSLLNTMKEYVPALINQLPKRGRTKENDFSLLLTVENTEALSNTLKLPFTIMQQGRITGQYDNQHNKFNFDASLPQFNIGKSMFEAGYLSCDNLYDQVNLEVKAINYNQNGQKNVVNLQAKAKENKVDTDIHWSNNRERMFRADLSASTLFTEEERENNKRPALRTDIKLKQSPVVINDTLWNVLPSSIRIQEGQVNVRDFKVTHDKQYIHLDGQVSKDPNDTLKLNLNQIELSYIFDILNIPVLQFAGKATGAFNINDLFGSRILNTDLEVKDFSFNKVTLGRLNLYSEWDDEQQGILMLGSIYKNDTTWTDVNGYIYPVGPKAGLSLHFDANDINVAFLSPFVEKVVKDIKGHGFGHVHLYGPFKNLNVEGDAYVADGGVGIEFTNTYYTFSDSVHMDSLSVNLKNITVKDKFNNSGKVNLKFNHKHFRDFDFLVDISANRMLMYDATRKHNPLIYGTVFGSGSARIKGNEKLVDFDINMRSEPDTKVYLDFLNNNSAEEYDFITFVDKKKQLTVDSLSNDTLRINPFASDKGAELRMNFLLDITPDANIELIMDPVAGDRIKGIGTGSLQVQYGTNTDLRMYGGVNITEGNYNFSLQQIIHKDFKIRDGSTIDFHGDPFNANMNINAIYNLTANLSDLDQGLAVESPRMNVPVNCVLMLDGMLRSPTISFDLELPGSNEELERQVKSLVDTDDMMTRQIVYLLVLNKFYTPDYTNGYRSNDLNAVASSAISSQLSSILSSFTDKVQIGANIRAGQEGFDNSTEMEMLLSSQLLDNRLLINGNFGYKNSYYTEQKNVFVGEFDLEYKLTKNGEIRLKAYNHANDMYQYLKQSLTTQGVGIMFKKDFTHLSEMFQRRKKLLLAPLPQDSVATPKAKVDSIVPPQEEPRPVTKKKKN